MWLGVGLKDNSLVNSSVSSLSEANIAEIDDDGRGVQLDVMVVASAVFTRLSANAVTNNI